MASKQKKPRKVNGYKMPAPIPTGFIVKNTVLKQSWSVGESIGKGGFGEIYCCCTVDSDGGSSKSKKKVYPYVMKIEPQENGPLFVEMHFYMKVAKKDDIENWMKSKGIKKLGMPCYLGSGSFEYDNDRYRYIVMDRYGRDIWSIFLENKIFPCATALKIALQILDVLEYIHEQGYAHCDVKGANLLLGTQKGFEDQVYLVDFGLASRYTTAPFKPDPKKAHNGTIEYTSRDAHEGVVTRRGDMEILGFNLLHWITSKLPWDDATDPKVAEGKKKSLMANVTSSIKKLTPPAPPVLAKYLEYVSKLKHDETPDYDKCRKLFKDELKALGAANDGKLLFKAENPGKKTPKKTVAKNSRRGKVPTQQGSDDGSSQEDDSANTKKLGKRTPKKSAATNSKRGKVANQRGSDDVSSEEEGNANTENPGKKNTKKPTVASSKRAKVANGYESSEEEDNVIAEKPGKKTPKRLVVTGTKRAKATNGYKSSEEEDNDILEKRGVKNKPSVKNSRKAKVASEHVSTEEDDDFIVSDEEHPQTPKRTRPNAKLVKPSWKDCPTAIASNTGRAGEYVSLNPKPVKCTTEIASNMGRAGEYVSTNSKPINCPTEIASDMGRAGEYVSINPKPIKRQRKK